MPIFAYKAADGAGNTTSGRVEADNRFAAIDRIGADGLHPITVEEAGTRGRAPAPALFPAGRVSRASVDAFTRELGNLLAGGVPLSRALSILAREASQAAARLRWQAIYDDVVGGMPLAEAVARWPRSFPPVYVAMVRAGETGGFLDVVLQQIAEFRAREQDLVGRVKAALVYPIVLAVLATLVLIFLMTYFIPRFSAIFAEFGGALPWLTRAIVTASEVVVNHGLTIAVVAALGVVAARRILVSQTGRRALERVVLGTPGLGPVMARFALVRFGRMLGTLLGAGVPMIASLRVAKEAVGNQTLADTVADAIEKVRQGVSLARSLAVSPRLFPASVVEMVAVAEQTGRLDKELVRLAAAYEAELDRRLRMLVALAEPAMLFIMAALIGTVVIGMLLPVFTLQDLIR